MIHLGMSVSPSVNALDQKYRIQFSPGSIRLQVQFGIKIHHKLVLPNLCVEYRSRPSSISKCHTQCMHVWIIFVRWRGEMEFVVGGEAHRAQRDIE